MPLPPNLQDDPIVTILRLAYRRGLAVQREQTKQSKAMQQQSFQNDLLTVEQAHTHTMLEASNIRTGEGLLMMDYKRRNPNPK
jgi:hypothetical protein